MNPYAATVARLESGNIIADDFYRIMALLGYEVRPNRRSRFLCRPIGSAQRFQALPSLYSADDAARWLRHTGGEIEDAGGKGDAWHAGFSHPDYGNDYGTGPRLGFAIWAAFVRLFGKVDEDDMEEAGQ